MTNKRPTTAMNLARERFIVQMQAALYDLMLAHGVTQSDMAKRMGVSPARISHIFSSEGNVTLRTVGEMIHAIGCEPEVWVSGKVLRVSAQRKA